MTAHQTIEKVDFNEHQLDQEYCNCTFKACNFAQTTLQHTDFEDCVFDACDLSLCKFKNIVRDTKFKECKLVGADFLGLDKCSNGLVFESCSLNYANFVAVRIRKTLFQNCTINEAFFDRADLTLSVFDRCDLTRSSFHEVNLEGVDFSTSFNFSINPSVCKLKNAIFSEADLKGLLDHLNIVIKSIGE